MYCDLLTIGTWGHPSPLRHADVLNGWSLRQLAAVANKDIEKVSTNLGQAILSKSQRQMAIREIQRSRLNFESRWAERYPPPVPLYPQET